MEISLPNRDCVSGNGNSEAAIAVRQFLSCRLREARHGNVGFQIFCVSGIRLLARVHPSEILSERSYPGIYFEWSIALLSQRRGKSPRGVAKGVGTPENRASVLKREMAMALVILLKLL